jgi:AcrR family transcriptional regulator
VRATLAIANLAITIFVEQNRYQKLKVAPKLRLSSDERRASIIAAACKLFSEKGFRGTTTRELAAAVGVTEPVLYEHFNTKRDLYAAIIESKAKQGIDSVKALAEQYAESDDDRGFFRALGKNIVDWYTNDPVVVRLLLFSNLEGHELKDLFHERGSCCFSVVISHIERRIQQGAIRAIDPALAARAFFGMVAHYALTGLVFGFAPFATKTTEQVIDEMVDIFLAGTCATTNAK